MGGVGDVPSLNGRVIDTTDRKMLRIGAPPESAIATHFFSSDEVSRTPGHRF